MIPMCAFCIVIGVLLILVIQQCYLLDVESADRRRLLRKRKLSSRREPFFPSPDYRKVMLKQFSIICRELMRDSTNKLELRQRGNLILQELAA